MNTPKFLIFLLMRLIPTTSCTLHWLSSGTKIRWSGKEMTGDACFQWGRGWKSSEWPSAGTLPSIPFSTFSRRHTSSVWVDCERGMRTDWKIKWQSDFLHFFYFFLFHMVFFLDLYHHNLFPMDVFKGYWEEKHWHEISFSHVFFYCTFFTHVTAELKKYLFWIIKNNIPRLSEWRHPSLSINHLNHLNLKRNTECVILVSQFAFHSAATAASNKASSSFSSSSPDVLLWKPETCQCQFCETRHSCVEKTSKVIT